MPPLHQLALRPENSSDLSRSEPWRSAACICAARSTKAIDRHLAGVTGKPRVHDRFSKREPTAACQRFHKESGNPLRAHDRCLLRPAVSSHPAAGECRHCLRPVWTMRGSAQPSGWLRQVEGDDVLRVNIARRVFGAWRTLVVNAPHTMLQRLDFLFDHRPIHRCLCSAQIRRW